MEEAESSCIIIGGGLEGLLIARDLSHEGVQVTILEASGNIGGQIYDHTFSDPRIRSVGIGASYFDIALHDELRLEFKRYKITVLKKEYTFTFVQTKDGTVGTKDRIESASDYLSNIRLARNYKFSIAKLNEDAMLLDTSMGFATPSREYFDIPASTYLENTLGISRDESLWHFLAYCIWSLTGGVVEEVSMMHILTIIASFRDAERAFYFHWPNSTALIAGNHLGHGGMSTYVNKLKEDILAHHGRILYHHAVTAIQGHETPHSPKTQILDYSSSSIQLMYQRVTVYATITDPTLLIPHQIQSFETRQAIIALPLHCAASINVTPSWPPTLQAALRRCAVSSEHHPVTILAYASGISHRIDRMIALQHEAVIESTIHQRIVLDEGEDEEEDDKRSVKDAAVVSITIKRSSLIRQQQQQINNNLMRIIQQIYPTAQPIDHIPDAVYVHDWATRRWTRGVSFHLHPGTGLLHSEAAKQALEPWKVEYPDGKYGGLCLASSQLGVEWTGWIEGVIRHAKKMSKELLPLIVPPKVERNFARKVKRIDGGGVGEDRSVVSMSATSSLSGEESGSRVR